MSRTPIAIPRPHPPYFTQEEINTTTKHLGSLEELLRQNISRVGVQEAIDDILTFREVFSQHRANTRGDLQALNHAAQSLYTHIPQEVFSTPGIAINLLAVQEMVAKVVGIVV